VNYSLPQDQRIALRKSMGGLFWVYLLGAELPKEREKEV
jgi:hypothetical protein